MVGTADEVLNSRGPVPRGSPVTFHVRIEAEEFTIGVEGDAIGVALAGREQSRVLTVPIETQHKAARSLAPGSESVDVLQSRHCQILGIMGHRRVGRQIARHVREVTSHGIDPIVGPFYQRVRSVLTATARPTPEQLSGLIATITIGIPDPVQVIPVRASTIHVQGPVGMQQAHGPTYLGLQSFHLGEPALLDRQAEQRLRPLGTDNQTPLIVPSHGNP